MLLQRLKDYAVRMEAVQPPGYALRRIKWELALSRDGRFLKAILLAQATKGPEARGPEISAPTLVRSSADVALLLADTGEYALGRPARDDAQRRAGTAYDSRRAAKTPKRHHLFRELVRECATETRDPTVAAVSQFLESLTLFDPGEDLRCIQDGAPKLPDEFEFGDQLTFSVEGTRPIDLPPVRDFWAKKIPGTSDEGRLGYCLVCGQARRLMQRMPMSIKGIPGGQSSGNALISANSPAFESYGLENSLIAGCCRPCAEAFHAGLQALIGDEHTSLRDTGQVAVFWSRRDQETVDLGIVDQPSSEAVRALLQSPHTARRAAVDVVDPRDFFCLMLSTSGSRIAIQAWIETSVDEARRNLARYFLLQRLVRVPREPHDRGLVGPPVGLWRLQRALLRSNAGNRDLPPKNVRVALLRTALEGARLPVSLLARAVRRCQLEQSVTYERALLIKMILCQRRERERPIMDEEQTAGVNQEPDPTQWEGLDLSFASPGYLCGRALAVLDQIQRSALPNVKAILVDRYFTGASQSPHTVFPRLIQNAQNHLAKLRGQPAGFALEKRLGEILSGLHAREGFPRTLNLSGQAEFCLGYYHQREDGFLQARLHKQAKQDTPGATAA